MFDQTRSSTVCVTVCLDPDAAATLARRAREHRRSLQAELRAAVTEHIAPQHPHGEGAGCWKQDVATQETW